MRELLELQARSLESVLDGTPTKGLVDYTELWPLQPLLHVASNWWVDLLEDPHKEILLGLSKKNARILGAFTLAKALDSRTGVGHLSWEHEDREMAKQKCIRKWKAWAMAQAIIARASGEKLDATAVIDSIFDASTRQVLTEELGYESGLVATVDDKPFPRTESLELARAMNGTDLNRVLLSLRAAFPGAELIERSEP